MKEQLTSSVEARGVWSEAYVHWNLSLHIPSFSRRFTRSHRVTTIYLLRWSRRRKMRATPQLPCFPSFLPNIRYKTSTRSLSKATTVCRTLLARHVRRHKFRLSDTTRGRSEAARYRVQESRRRCSLSLQREDCFVWRLAGVLCSAL